MFSVVITIRPIFNQRTAEVLLGLYLKKNSEVRVPEAHFGLDMIYLYLIALRELEHLS